MKSLAEEIQKLQKLGYGTVPSCPLALCEQDMQAETLMLCQAATYGLYLQTPDRVFSPSDQQVNQTADSYLNLRWRRINYSQQWQTFLTGLGIKVVAQCECVCVCLPASCCVSSLEEENSLSLVKWETFLGGRNWAILIIIIKNPLKLSAQWVLAVPSVIGSSR